MFCIWFVFFFIFHSGSFTFKSHWTQLTRYMANSIFIFQWNVLPKRYMHFIGCNFHHSLFYLFFFSLFRCCFFIFVVRFLCTAQYTISIFWASSSFKFTTNWICAAHLHKSNHSRVQIQNSLGSFVSHILSSSEFGFV